MKRTFAPAQQNYLKTKAEYDYKHALVQEIIGECTAQTDEEIDQWCEREAEIHSQLGIAITNVILRQAEDELLDWGVQHLSSLYPGYRTIVEQVARTRHLQFRERAIDLVMQIDAAAVPRN
jgi:hypothetical protein